MSQIIDTDEYESTIDGMDDAVIAEGPLTTRYEAVDAAPGPRHRREAVHTGRVVTGLLAVLYVGAVVASVLVADTTQGRLEFLSWIAFSAVMMMTGMLAATAFDRRGLRHIID